MYVCMRMYVCYCMYVTVCMYVCMYVCMCACVRACVRACCCCFFVFFVFLGGELVPALEAGVLAARILVNLTFVYYLGSMHLERSSGKT